MNNYESKSESRITIGINEIYTFFLIISPILFIYGIGIGSVTLSDLILIVLNILLILKGMLLGNMKIHLYFLPFFIYTILLTLSINFDMDILLRSFRYIFYLFNIVFLIKTFFNYNFAIKIYRIISLVSTGYLFLQIIIYRVFNIYLPGVVLSANLVATDLYEYDRVIQNAQYKRFMSFFEEPSHFAIYILGYITILLFAKMSDNISDKKNIFEFCFLATGIVLSTSILGVFVLGALVIIWYVRNILKDKKSIFRLVSFIVVILVFITLISQTTAFEYFTNSNIVDRQSEGRFNGYLLLFDIGSNSFTQVFGNGMIRLQQGLYLPSYPLLIFYFGYIGLILFLLAFIPYIIRGKLNITAALSICLLGISLGSEILLGRFILVFLPLIITATFREKK